MATLIRKTKSLLVVMAWVPTMFISYSVHGIELDGEFNVGMGSSDNITRTSQAPISDVFTLVGLKLDIVEESRRIRTNVQSQFDFLTYRDDTYDDELVGGLNGFAEFAVVEERVAWFIQDNYGQQLFDPFTPATPSNRENVNFFTTGPTIKFLKPGRNHANLDLRYSSENYELSPDDNERYSSRALIGREINRRSTVSIGGLYEKLKFDVGAPQRDYDRVEGFIRLGIAGNKNRFEIDAGTTEIQSDLSRNRGPLVRINWTSELSTKSTLIMSGGSTYSDRGGRFRSAQDDASDLRDTIDITTFSAPFRENFFTGRYRVEQDRTNINLIASWIQEDYQGGEPLDRDSYRAEALIRRDISRKVFGTMRVGFFRRDYKYLDRLDKDFLANLGVGFRFGSRLSVTLNYQYLERDSNTDGGTFTDQRYSIRAMYTPRWMQ